MMIKGVIFDLDGVLLDSMFIWKDLGVRYLMKNGCKPEAHLSEILFSMSMEQGEEYLSTHYPLAKEPEQIGDEIQKMLKTFYFDEVRSKEGAADLMKYLAGKGIAMIAATSSPRAHVEQALLRNGLLPYLREVLTTSELETSKHEPLIYRVCAEKLGFEPEELLVLEDSLYALKTAKEAGFHVVGVYDANGEEDQESLENFSECYIDSLTQLISYLEEKA